MSNSQFISSSNAVVPPNGQATVLTFLQLPGVACNEAYVVAQAGGTTPGDSLDVYVTNHTNDRVSNTAQTFSSDPARVTVPNVQLRSSARPELYNVVAVNNSSNEARVDGVLLVQ